MDRNQTIGFILIALILALYFLFIAPKYYQQNTPQVDTTKTKVVENNIKNIVDTIPSESDSLANIEKNFIIENQNIKLTVSSKGAIVKKVQVKNYKTFKQQDLILFEGEDNYFNLRFYAKNRLYNTKDLHFESKTHDTILIANDKEKTLVLRHYVDSTSYIEYIYTIVPNAYTVDFKVNFVNLKKYFAVGTTFIEFDFAEKALVLERGDKWERQNVNLYYRILNEDVRNLKPNKDKASDEVPFKLQWISFKQQFFNTSLISHNYFENVKLSYISLNDDTSATHLFKAQGTMPFKLVDNYGYLFTYYFGPNKYSVLNKIKIDNQKAHLEKLIPLGGTLVGWINKWLIIPIFNFLGKYIFNFGIIILVLTIIIKIILWPLTHKTYLSTAKMRILKPEVDKILSKIPQEKALERQQATMELYKKAGVSPFGGCLPTLLQFPILFALYRFFPASIELRQQKFLWVDDLSTYDAILTWNYNIPIINWIFGNHISLFTMLMAIAMIVQTWLSSKNQPASVDDAQAKSMKFMMYFMPLLMVVWFNGYSAALSYYFFLSTVLGILQMYISQWIIDEDKILAQLQENIQKNKNINTKSQFQRKLEELQKQQNKKYKR